MFILRAIHGNRRSISAEILSVGKKEKKTKKESSCFQISVLANVRAPLDRGGGGGESEKKTNQR